MCLLLSARAMYGRKGFYCASFRLQATVCYTSATLTHAHIPLSFEWWWCGGGLPFFVFCARASFRRLASENRCQRRSFDSPTSIFFAFCFFRLAREIAQMHTKKLFRLRRPFCVSFLFFFGVACLFVLPLARSGEHRCRRGSYSDSPTRTTPSPSTRPSSEPSCPTCKPSLTNRSYSPGKPCLRYI